jgi:hypothetical protein
MMKPLFSLTGANPSLIAAESEDVMPLLPHLGSLSDDGQPGHFAFLIPTTLPVMKFLNCWLADVFGVAHGSAQTQPT